MIPAGENRLLCGSRRRQGTEYQDLAGNDLRKWLFRGSSSAKTGETSSPDRQTSATDKTMGLRARDIKTPWQIKIV